MTTERIDDADGTYMLVDFHAEDGSPAPKARATYAEITKYSAAGDVILRTYGAIGAKVKVASRAHHHNKAKYQ